jgi:hypothetical protein
MRMTNIYFKSGFLFILCIVAAIASTRAKAESPDMQGNGPEAEFQMARVKYRTFGGGGSHGYFQPWWAIDYPLAEEHFFPALRRTTNVQVADEERHLELSDDRIFEYPFLFLQQPGMGNWRPTPNEAARLREYCLRGGFLLVDDLHAEWGWAVFEKAIRQVFPDRPIVEIPDDDALMHVFFDLDKSMGIPGDRHLRIGRGGQTVARMEGPPHWRGIYDDHGHIMVAVNFNSDMGDGWEHADDPFYPVPFTALAYKFGINYIIYAMTH